MTAPELSLANCLLLPELKLIEINWSLGLLVCEKRSEAEVCHRCATLCHAGSGPVVVARLPVVGHTNKRSCEENALITRDGVVERGSW